MQIEIQLADKIPVKYGDREFSVIRPKVGTVRSYQKALKAANEDDQAEVMINFCISVGVPQDIVNDWDLVQISSFFRQLSSDEKKS